MANKRLTNDIIDARIKNTRYIRLEDYKGSLTPIKFQCKECKTIVKRSPSKLANTCQICSNKLRTKSDKEFKRELKEKNIPYVNIDPYIGRNYNIRSTCKCSIPHIWKTQPGHILNGSKCPKCSTNSFNKNKPCLLYLVKLKSNEPLYKLGITSRSTKDRFKGDTNNIDEIIYEKWFESGAEAYNVEQNILNKYKNLLVDCYLLKYGGNTEVFGYNIIDIINKEVS